MEVKVTLKLSFKKATGTSTLVLNVALFGISWNEPGDPRRGGTYCRTGSSEVIILANQGAWHDLQAVCVSVCVCVTVFRVVTRQRG